MLVFMHDRSMISRQENVLEMYESDVKQRMDEYDNKTTRQKYASVDTYVEFKQRIYVCRSRRPTRPFDISLRK